MQINFSSRNHITKIEEHTQVVIFKEIKYFVLNLQYYLVRCFCKYNFIYSYIFMQTINIKVSFVHTMYGQDIRSCIHFIKFVVDIFGFYSKTQYTYIKKIICFFSVILSCLKSPHMEILQILQLGLLYIVIAVRIFWRRRNKLISYK